MIFRKRMLLLFFLLSIVPFIILQVNTQVFYIPTITNRIKALFTYNLQQKMENLQRLLVERMTIFSQVVNDQGLTAIIQEVNAIGEPSFYQQFQMLDYFSRYTINNDLMAGIGFIRNDGLVIEYDRFGLHQAFTDFSMYGSVAAITRAVGAQGSQLTFPSLSYQISSGIHRTIIMTVFPYYDLNTNRREGFLFFLLNESAFRMVLNPTITDDSGIVARSILYDSLGRLISFPDDTVFPPNQGFPMVRAENLADIGQRMAEFKGKRIGWISLNMPKTDWTISTLYDEQTLFSDRNNMILYTFLVGLVFFVSASLVIWASSRKILWSFTNLVEKVRIEDNRLNIHQGTTSNDDLEYLGTAFRRMQDHINGLVTDVNERNAQMLALAEEQRLSEIRALEAQVNPHFLYNTLNTLNWIAIRNKQSDLSQGLSNLADIMRYSISQIEVTASLEEEVTWLRKYLDLQQLRFRHNFVYTIVNRGVDTRFRIFKLLFQPLVENALVHGFDPNIPGGLLEIEFEMNESHHLVATISDNGRGFAPIPSSQDTVNDSIGLANLERRLAVYYRQEGRIQISGRPNGGTIAVLEIPEAPS